uniref:Cleavage and polyadenylation specific factor 1 n=1 Tax=Mus musculus TaxID=10090 RepID=A0A2R8VK03_MOUSE
MYAVYKQAHPPTGLEFTMYCNFFNNSERNLVVAGTSQLYVYRLNRDAEALTKNDGSTVCSLQAPNVMPCFSVSKTLSCLWWSMTQALMT